ncbi:citrate (Si)-synthase [Alicyclobacillus ferrooxydans]|uniref:citrate synthase (unknown stereospecificity) n=1 Tax=Alicyclobacillus ferrooxydans TaxID=471514 RepID=A0A0P9C9K8_9BACL|nr:citrate (Si)-synthase [Alicyclobacillus ferrooxydans]KPV42055.1 type I citrate synthase [Alicyclobacillus ferrooxydans]
MLLKDQLAEKISQQRTRTTKLLKEFGDVKIDEVTISQVVGGMRGIKSMVTDISYLDPEEGIRFRGYTIPEVMEKLPKVPGGEMPYVEGQFYLLLTGEIPTLEEVQELAEELKSRRALPEYVKDILRAMPRDAHPMTMFTAGIVAMQRESKFAKYYNEGHFNKNTAWEPMLEDALDLIAKLPVLGAYIYRMKYRGDTFIPSTPDLDLGGDFANMMGIAKPYDDVARMYFILHADHESGNVSAHTAHLVGSALSDVYYAYSAAMAGLAGPLHGLANQEVLKWIQELMKTQSGGQVPTQDELKKFVEATLSSGQVVPGYGHAVLRKTDPRYMAQREFALAHLKDDPIFKVVSMLFEVVPPILSSLGKVKNPWPNVDAQSGVIQWHYGVVEYDFYTVLFGIGRSLGVLANLVWDRALGYSIERPKSVTTDMLEEWAGIPKPNHAELVR